MKIGRILFLMSALAFSQAGMANHQASDKNSAADKMWVLDVDKQLEYCHKQVGRALDELRQKDGSYDFSMEPRNILKGDRQKGWNCRKATPEEWCDRFCRAFSGWIIRTPRMRLYARLLRAIRNL